MFAMPASGNRLTVGRAFGLRQAAEIATITFGLRFPTDHADRELPTGRIVRESRTQITLAMTEEEAAELRSDADYYATLPHGEGDPGMRRAARGTLRKLAAAGL